MVISDVTNNATHRLCRASSAQSRYPTVIVTLTGLLLLLMMFYGGITATALVASSVAVSGDTATGTPPVAASVSPVSVRAPQNAVGGRFQFASLPLQDDSSGGKRLGAVGRRALIAAHRQARSDVRGHRTAALRRTEVVNYLHPPATTTTAAATVNVAPVIRTSRDRREGPGRISIISTLPHRRSSFNAVFHALGASSHQPDNDYLQTSTRYSIIVDGTATSVKEFTYFGQPNSTHRSPVRYSASTYGPDRVHTFSGISEDANLDLKHGKSRDVRRIKRESGVKSSEEIEPQLDGDQLNATITPTPSDGTPTVRTSETESVDMPLGAAALRYRSRGNFAALVDSLKTGDRAPAVAASANKWRRLATVGDNSTSSSSLTEEATPASAAASTSRTFTDYDSIDVKVIHIAINGSTNVTHSVPVTSQTLNDITLVDDNEILNSTVVSSGEGNCSKVTKSHDLQDVLRQRIPDSAVTVCAYTFSFLFTLVAACAVTSFILSLCVRNRRLPHVADRRSSSQVVLGLLVLAAAARALHYLAVEYQLLATVATPGGLRAIYECWFPFVSAAFFVHQSHLHDETVTLKNGSASPNKDNRAKSTACWRELRVFGIVLCFCLKLVFVLCLLIEFCVIPVKAVFVLRCVFVLFAVSLSRAYIPIITLATSGRHIATQVVLRALFVICAGFSAVNAATLLSDDFSLAFQQNSSVPIAVEAANGVAEFIVSVLLCVNSTLTFSGFQCRESQITVNVGHKVVLATSIEKKKIADHGQSSEISTNSPVVRQSWLSRLLDSIVKKSKVVDAGSPPPQISLGVVHAVGWTATEDPVDRLSPLPPPSRMMRSRSMLYNDHGFIRFRQDGDTDGESDARTLDDDGGGPRSAPASEYASAESLSFHRGGASSTGTPRWSRPGSPSLAGFRAPSIHLQDSIDRALDRCDIWRVGREQGQLSVDELRCIIEFYADVGDWRRGNRYHQRRVAATPPSNYASEV